MSRYSELAERLEEDRVAITTLDEAAAALRELEQGLNERNKQLGVACDKHDLTHSLACGRCHAELRAENERLMRDLRAANKGAERNMKLAEAVTTTNMNLKTENERLREEYCVAQEALAECVALWFDDADPSECDKQILRFNDVTAGLRIRAALEGK